MKLEDRVAIVTGGASGIGRAIAHVFTREGANVVIADINLDGAIKVANELKVLGAEGLAVKTDVSKEQDVKAMVQETITKFNKIDILVNNAARGYMPKYFYETEPSDWDAEINVTLKGVLLCSWAVIPHMIARRSGRIINISSNAGKATPERLAVYGACKAGIAAFGRCLAQELGAYGILVNSVSPGTIRTPATEGQKEVEEMAANITILRRQGEPEDIANMVLFLASEDGKYITAQNYSVDGGMTSS